MPTWNDPAFLLAHQYRNADNLQARQALHERFGRSVRPWFDWVFDHFPEGDALAVLEVGAGPAALWRATHHRVKPGWTLTLTDLSAGMVAAAREALADTLPTARFLTADVQDLPFDDGAFDLVVANHMLYHVPDQERALSEIRRVLRPGGRLIAATNGDRHMAELWELMRAALPNGRVESPGLAFRLDTGADLLAQHFERVERFDLDSALEVDEVEPLLAYIASTHAVGLLAEGESPARIDAALGALRAEIAGRLARDGVIRIVRQSGLFRAG